MRSHTPLRKDLTGQSHLVPTVWWPGSYPGRFAPGEMVPSAFVSHGPHRRHAHYPDRPPGPDVLGSAPMRVNLRLPPQPSAPPPATTDRGGRLRSRWSLLGIAPGAAVHFVPGGEGRSSGSSRIERYSNQPRQVGSQMGSSACLDRSRELALIRRHRERPQEWFMGNMRP